MKKLKRHCYFDHKNNRERHIWCGWKREKDEWIRNRCKRCTKVKFKIDTQGMRASMKRVWGKIDMYDVLSAPNPFLRLIPKNEGMTGRVITEKITYRGRCMGKSS